MNEWPTEWVTAMEGLAQEQLRQAGECDKVEDFGEVLWFHADTLEDAEFRRGLSEDLGVEYDEDEDDEMRDVLWSPKAGKVFWDEYPYTLKCGVTDARVALAVAQETLGTTDISVRLQRTADERPSIPVTINDDGTWQI